MLKKYLYTGGLALFIIITLLLFNILGIFTDQGFVTEQLEKNNATERISNAKEIDQNVRTYLTEPTKELNQTKLTQREILHLEDVKNLYTVGNILVALFFFLIALGLFYHLMPRLWEFGLVLLGFVALIVGLGAIAQWQFDSLFTLFHKIVFTNDLWLLSAEHTLIKLYPQEFFLNSFLKALDRTFIITLALSLIFLATGLFRLKKKPDEENESEKPEKKRKSKKKKKKSS